MDKGLLTASILLIIAGIGLLAAGAIFQTVLVKRQEGKIRVRAKVVDLVLHPGGSGQFENYYYPVLEYYARGKLYKLEHPDGGYPSRYRIGQEIALDLDGEDPSVYEIAGDDREKRTASLLYAAGVVCLAAGCVIFVRFAQRG